jgi:hypothetical protein
MKGAKNLEGLERFGEEGEEAVDLIASMLHGEAHERCATLFYHYSTFTHVMIPVRTPRHVSYIPSSGTQADG